MNKNIVVSMAAITAVVIAGCKGKDKSETKASAPEKQAEKVVETTSSADLCTDFGPQTPRDISFKAGTNKMKFPMAPSHRKMNLCNIHTHTLSLIHI